MIKDKQKCNYLKRIASFDVDPQKGFTPLCPDELPIPEGNLIVDALNKNAKLAKYRIVSRDIHPEKAMWNAEKPENMLEKVGLPNVDVKWNPHCRMNTVGAELLDGLPHPIIGYDFSIAKGMDGDCHPYGACYHDLENKRTTGVIEYLKMEGVEFIIVGGLATEFCVYQTVKQLASAGFYVLVNKEAVRGLDGAKNALREMNDCIDRVQVFADSIEIKDYLKGCTCL